MKPSSDLLEVYVALCDVLVDDDEDVRDQGANTVSLLLSAIESKHASDRVVSLSLSPIAARRRLKCFLEQEYRMSRELRVEAVERLTGVQTSNSVKMRKLDDNQENNLDNQGFQLRPVAELSLEARTTQFVVFVEEKQNLYIDTVREAEEWATFMTKVNPDAWDTTILSILESWTVDGLTYFIETCENQIDGALGPTSKSEVYTLWMRVILSAKVLMAWSAQASGKGRATEIIYRGLLEKLLGLGKQRLLHDLLLDHIE